MSEYLPILFFIAVAIGFAILLLILPHLFNPTRKDKEKLSPYECGFESFDNAHSRFDVRFYLVAILFVVFDLEVAFLFPWAMVFGDIGWLGFWGMMSFLVILTVGFLYEWRKGALEWE
jgi:NADH-quinone oxidoreductase subunit A